jgi:hypothetical protein
MHRLSELAFSMAATLVALTCSDAPTRPQFADCPGDTVVVEVVSGLAPSFRWSPTCGMQFLEVYPASGGGALWTVYGPAGTPNAISSGVLYGRTPSGARTVAGPVALNSSTLYRIRVSRLICDQGVLCILSDAGSAQFQR